MGGQAGDGDGRLFPLRVEIVIPEVGYVTLDGVHRRAEARHFDADFDARGEAVVDDHFIEGGWVAGGAGGGRFCPLCLPRNCTPEMRDERSKERQSYGGAGLL